MISVCGVSTILAYFNGLMIAISGFVVGDSAPRAHAWAHVLAVVLTDGGMPNRSNVPRAMLVMVHIAADYRGPRELPYFWGFDAEDTSRDFWHDATLRTSVAFLPAPIKYQSGGHSQPLTPLKMAYEHRVAQGATYRQQSGEARL